MSAPVVTSRLPAFLTALRSQLHGREGLAGVLIANAPPNVDDYELLTIVLCVSADMDQEWATRGNRQREETFTIHGTVTVLSPDGGEESADLARSQAFALLAEVEAQARDDFRVVDWMVSYQVKPRNLSQFALANGRVCDLDFDLTATARLPRSAS